METIHDVSPAEHRLQNIEEWMKITSQQLSDIRYTLRTVDRRLKRQAEKEKKLAKEQKEARKGWEKAGFLPPINRPTQPINPVPLGRPN